MTADNSAKKAMGTGGPVPPTYNQSYRIPLPRTYNQSYRIPLPRTYNQSPADAFMTQEEAEAFVAQDMESFDRAVIRMLTKVAVDKAIRQLTCTTCNGTGEVALFTSVEKCGECQS